MLSVVSDDLIKSQQPDYLETSFGGKIMASLHGITLHWVLNFKNISHQLMSKLTNIGLM